MSKTQSFTDRIRQTVGYRLALETGTLLMPDCIQEPSEIQTRMWNALWINYK